MSEYNELSVYLRREPAWNEGSSSPFDSVRRTRPDGSEYWSGRDLMPMAGYAEWRRFRDAIERARVSCLNQGTPEAAHFVQVSQLVGAGNLGEKEREDFELTRFACYLTFQNGDPRKPEVAAAQAYFAIRTREAEVAKPAIPRNYAAALREAADQAERAELAESKAKELEAKAVEDAPAVAAAQKFFDLTNELYSRREAARMLDIPERLFMDMLREWGWFEVLSNAAKAYAVNQGYAQNKTYITKYGDSHVYGKLTTKGVERANRKLVDMAEGK